MNFSRFSSLCISSVLGALSLVAGGLLLTQGCAAGDEAFEELIDQNIPDARKPDAKSDASGDGARPDANSGDANPDGRPTGDATVDAASDTAQSDAAGDASKDAVVDSKPEAPAFTCADDEYDVDNSTTNGCEKVDIMNNHSRQTAYPLGKTAGNADLTDGQVSITVTNSYYSDVRTHVPSNASGQKGRADWFVSRRVEDFLVNHDPHYYLTVANGKGQYKFTVYREVSGNLQQDSACPPHTFTGKPGVQTFTLPSCTEFATFTNGRYFAVLERTDSNQEPDNLYYEVTFYLKKL